MRRDRAAHVSTDCNVPLSTIENVPFSILTLGTPGMAARASPSQLGTSTRGGGDTRAIE